MWGKKKVVFLVAAKLEDETMLPNLLGNFILKVISNWIGFCYIKSFAFLWQNNRIHFYSKNHQQCIFIVKSFSIHSYINK